MAQADPLAVMAEVMDRTRVQPDRHRGHARGPGVRHGHGPPPDHVLRRPGRGVRGHRRGAGQARLSPAEYARYEASLSGRSSSARSSRPPWPGPPWARSWTWPRAGLHGRPLGGRRHARPPPRPPGYRLEPGRGRGAGAPAGRAPSPSPGPSACPRVVPPEARALGGSWPRPWTPAGAELAQRQAERPEPWVLDTLGAFPAEGSRRFRPIGSAGSARRRRTARPPGSPTLTRHWGRPRGTPGAGDGARGTVRALEIRTATRSFGPSPGRPGGDRGDYTGGHSSARGLGQTEGRADGRARGAGWWTGLQAEGQAEAGRPGLVWANDARRARHGAGTRGQDVRGPSGGPPGRAQGPRPSWPWPSWASQARG